MAFDYASLAATAKRLIDTDQRGRTITLLKSGTADEDGSKPWRGATAPATEASPAVELSVRAVFINQADLDNWGLIERDEDGTLLKRGTERFLVAADSISPATDIRDFDGIKDGTRIWRIDFINVLAPGDVTLLYDIRVLQ